MKHLSHSALFIFLILIAVSARAQHRMALLKGNAITDDPVYGIKGVAAPHITPGTRLGALEWTANGKMYLFGGMGTQAHMSYYYADFWEYDPATGFWRYLGGPKGTIGAAGVYGTRGVSAASNWPGARMLGVTWVRNSKLYMFGGTGMASVVSAGGLNDVWEYDLTTAQWRWLKGSVYADQPPNYGTKTVASAANTPGTGSSGKSWSKGDSLYTFWENGEVWLYDIATNNWAWMSGGIPPTSFPPAAAGVCDTGYWPAFRKMPGLWTLNGKAYLFSGTPYSGDTWEYDPAGNCWKKIHNGVTGGPAMRVRAKGQPDTANTPGARQNPNCWTANNKLYMFGGHSSSPTGDLLYHNSLWCFDPLTVSWTWLHGDTAPDKPGNYVGERLSHPAACPGGREAAAQFTLGSDLYLYGGLGYDIIPRRKTLSDFWAYNTLTNEWRWEGGHFNLGNEDVPGVIGKPAAINMPQLDGMFASWQVADSFYVLSARTSAMWRYTIADNNWVCLRADTNRAPVYGTKGVFSAAAVPGGRTSAVSWSFNGRLFLFGGISDNYIYYTSTVRQNDIWEFDPATRNWRFLNGDVVMNGAPAGAYNVFAATNKPGAREGAGSVRFGDKLFLFGGHGIDSMKKLCLLNDLWCYDITLNQWALLKGRASGEYKGKYGTIRVAAATNCPGGRKRMQLWGLGGKLYIQGGDGYSAWAGGCLDDLWEYDTTTHNWRWLKGSDGSRSAQYSTFGTLGVPDPANVPSARYKSFTWTQDGKLKMFGGYTYGMLYYPTEGMLNDFWEYDTATYNWVWTGGATKFDSSGYYYARNQYSPGNMIGGRYGGASFLHDSKLYLLGGYGLSALTDFSVRQGTPAAGPDYQYMTDLWAYETCGSLSQCYSTPPAVRIVSESGDSLITVCDSIPVILNAGQPGSRYRWNTGDTTQMIVARTSGRYWVDLTSPGNLTGVDTVFVRFGKNPVFTLGNDTAVCANIPYLLNVFQPNSSYIWMDGSKSSGYSYYHDTVKLVWVEVEQDGCSAADSVRLTPLPLPGADSIALMPAGTAGSYMFAAANARNTDSLLWTFGDGASSNLPAPAHAYTADGSYQIRLVLRNGCGDDTLYRNLVVSGMDLGIGTQRGISWTVSPVPANDALHIMVDQPAWRGGRIRIFASDGTKVYDNGNAGSSTTIDTRGYPGGSYMIHLTDGPYSETRLVTVSH